MSIEQKIAELLAESKKLQAEENKVESITEEEFKALSEEEQAQYELVEGCYKKKAMKEESEEVKEELKVDVSEDVARSEEHTSELQSH